MKIMASSAIAFALAGAGIAVAAGGTEVVAPGAPKRREEDKIQGSPPSPEVDRVEQPVQSNKLKFTVHHRRHAPMFTPDIAGAQSVNVAYRGDLANPTPREVSDAAFEAMRADLENAGKAAKRKFCEYIKADFQDNESVQQIDCNQAASALLEAAFVMIATAGGAAIGGYFGGPIGAKIGAAVGAAVGKAGFDYIANAWDDSWAEEYWDEASEWGESLYEDVKELGGDVAEFADDVKNTAEDVGGAIKGGAKKVGSFLGSIF